MALVPWLDKPPCEFRPPSQPGLVVTRFTIEVFHFYKQTDAVVSVLQWAINTYELHWENCSIRRAEPKHLKYPAVSSVRTCRTYKVDSSRTVLASIKAHARIAYGEDLEVTIR